MSRPTLSLSSNRHRLFSLVMLAAWVLALATGCTSLLYYPDDVIYVDPATSFRKPPDDVVIKSATGEENHAWYFAALKPAKAIIVFCHGNGQNRSAHIVSMYWLVREGYDLLAIDYPGYADNDGEPTPQNTVEAAKAAIRYAVAKKPNLPLIVYGQSLGGAISMRAVLDLRSEVHPKLVVADSTFMSYKAAARGLMSKHWLTWVFQPIGGWVMSDAFAPGKEIAKLDAPLLVIHARDDSVIPFDLGEELFATANEPKEFWPLEKSDHIRAFILPEGASTRQRFLNKLASMAM